MQTILNLLQSAVPDAQTQRLVVIGAVALAALLMALAISAFVIAVTDPVRRRLGLVTGEGSGEGSAAHRLVKYFQKVGARLTPTSEKERDSVQRQLAYAGMRSPNALVVFYGVKTALALIFGAAMLIAAHWFPQVSTQSIYMYAMFAAGLGLFLPNTVLRRMVTRRQRRLRNAFPDALDMLVVCVEAGLGLTAALQRVADELQYSHPDLAGEFARVNAETRAGVERETALRNLTDRTGLEDIRGLVSLLVQTLRFGTSVADTLRVYSEEFRDRRMQMAEEQAAKMSTKLIFPLVLCMFPCFFVVAIGPAVMKIVEAFSQMHSG